MLQLKVAWYEEQIALAKQREFGHSRESSAEQLSLFHFDEAEQTANPQVVEPSLEVEEETPSRKRKRIGKRDEFWENLPVETTVYDLPEEERICDVCGETLHEMSEEVSRRLKIIPAQFIVEEHRRKVYSCRSCEQENIETPVVTAAAPNPPIPGSIASPSALAYVITQKYCEGMPLYRIEQFLHRLDLDVSRQNLSNWVVLSTERWLQPLYDELQRSLRQRRYAHSDETPLQVLKEPGRAPQTKSSMWLYSTSGCDADRAVILYDYQQTKAAKWPRIFLEGFEGFLHTDGAQSYEAAGLVGVTLVGCLAHCRRGFFKALKVLPKGVDPKDTHAAMGLEFCDRLFELERQYIKRNLDANERFRARLAYSFPVLQEFYSWLRKERPKVLPKSGIGQAISYCLNQWAKLMAFLLDGNLEISNNRAENHIRPFVVGRKAWLFSNTPRGAKASATAYSIIETAKANRLLPFQYLTWLFERLPNMELTEDNLQDTLPWSCSIPDYCKMSPVEDDS